MLRTLQLTHPAWTGPLLLVADAIDAALLDESGNALTFIADPLLQLPTPQIDDAGGRASMRIQIGNEGNAVGLLLDAASGERVRAFVRWHDGTLLLGPCEFDLHAPTGMSEPAISAELRSRNDNDLSAHLRTFSAETEPTLWGRN